MVRIRSIPVFYKLLRLEVLDQRWDYVRSVVGDFWANFLNSLRWFYRDLIVNWDLFLITYRNQYFQFLELGILSNFFLMNWIYNLIINFYYHRVTEIWIIADGRTKLCLFYFKLPKNNGIEFHGPVYLLEKLLEVIWIYCSFTEFEWPGQVYNYPQTPSVSLHPCELVKSMAKQETIIYDFVKFTFLVCPQHFCSCDASFYCFSSLHNFRIGKFKLWLRRNFNL
jgi:hypothetical protein